MNKSKIKEIIKFSFFKYFQNKWFIIFNIISLITIIFSLNWQLFSEIIPINNEEKTTQIAVLDSTNILDTSFYSKFEENENYEVNKINENNYTSENIPNNYIIIEVLPDEKEIISAKVISKEGIKNNIYEDISQNLKSERNRLLEDKYSISKENLQIFQNNVLIERIMLAVDAENSELKRMVNLFASALTYIIAVIVFTRIANEISQEKSSKASEYIMTAVSAKEYLFAKVFANIGILVIQIILMLSYYLISSSILSIVKVQTTDISLLSSFSINGLSKDIVIYLFTLIFYNIITLVLMSIIQATIAAKTTSSSEAGNTVSILIFIMAIMYVVTVGIIDPYTKANLFLQIISVLPIISSFFIPAMMVIGQASWWQIAVSIILLIVLIPKSFKKCSVAFKNGLLDYKKRKISNSKISESEQIDNIINKRTFTQLGSVIGISLLIYMGSQILIPIFITLAIDAFASNIGPSEKQLIIQMFTQIICLGLAYLFVRAYSSKEQKDNIAKPKLKIPKLQILLATLAIAVGLQILANFIYPLIGIDYEVTQMINVNSNSPIYSKILLLVSVAVTPAILEELFFRKGLIDLCLKHGKTFALFFSAIMFGYAHANLSQGIFAFLLGLAMAEVYIYTKDIKMTMLIHLINNGLAGLTMIFAEGSIIQNVIYALLIFTFVSGMGIIVYWGIKNKKSRASKQESANEELEQNTQKQPENKASALQNFKEKYVYMFYDYMFDISMVLLFVLSILQEKIYRNM